MYTRQGNRSKNISIPQNYSGNAFRDHHSSELLPDHTDAPQDSEESDTSIQQTDGVLKANEQKNFLPISIGNEELIIIGIILLIFQSNKSSDALPILLALLFLG